MASYRCASMRSCKSVGAGVKATPASCASNAAPGCLRIVSTTASCNCMVARISTVRLREARHCLERSAASLNLPALVEMKTPRQAASTSGGKRAHACAAFAAGEAELAAEAGGMGWCAHALRPNAANVKTARLTMFFILCSEGRVPPSSCDAACIALS
ncbi:hypothetical protein BN2476_470131 [Paraburkholderia piptadeniae]|uniref:Uncharacterized protein n=1 Tax=Paraburkholderia piptadeniae TaxID=1701573 RepID=A0A1N7SEF7_9BURK|nr:hypothetical protein BN2476_470131 [Paraburkholderia piptadeniae]